MWVRAARRVIDAAVVDVGSNSVRLVTYRVEGRAIWSLFNEKVLAGLGRDISTTGLLAPDGVDAALQALRRFRAVLDAVKPDVVHMAATAAVREAADGPAFLKRVREETGFDLKVITGEEEARLSALGVAAGAPDADGVVGDLGGFSLELVRLKAGTPQRGVTLPLGPFALAGHDPDGARRQAARVLAEVDGDFRAPCFYAVGGAWRSLALVHMRLNDYPLEILHQYEMPAREAIEAARFAARQSRGSLERIPGLSKKRAESLPPAAAVLEALIEQLGVERVAVSAYGLREGLLFDAMSPELKALDPLIAGCAALGARQEVAEDLGEALEAWLGPAFAALPPALEGQRDETVVAAACRLADLGSRLHPDHRPQLVFDQVLRAPVAGASHPERAFLAAASFARHASSPNLPESKTLNRLLTPAQIQRARALGAAVRLGCDLSGRSPVLLAKARIEFDPGRVVLTARKAAADLLLGEQTARRAQTLAGLLDRSLVIETR